MNPNTKQAAPTQDKQEQWSQKTVLILLIVITIAGSALRLYDVSGKSLWADEIATIASANGRSIDPDAYELKGQSFDPVTAQPAHIYKDKLNPLNPNTSSLTDTFDVLKDNVHPPFFFGLMHYWIQRTSTEPLNLRVPAIIFGALCIPALYWLAIEAGALPLTGLLAACFIALSGYQIDHSQDARQYTLLILLAICSFALLLQWIKHQTNNPQKQSLKNALPLVGITLLSTIGIYSQYFYALFLLVLYGYGFWHVRHNKAALRHLFICGVGVLMLFSPWLPYFKAQLAFLSKAGHYSNGLWNPVELPEKIFRNLNGFVIPNHILGSIIPPVILGLWAISQNTQNKTTPTSKNLLLGVTFVWISGVILLQIALDLLQQSQTVSIRRYTLITSPAYYLLLAYALMQIRWRFIQKLLCIITILTLGITSISQLTGSKRSSDDFKAASTYINTQYQNKDLVVVNRSGASAVGLAYYLNPDIKLLGFHAHSSDDLRDKKFFWCRYKREIEGILPNLETGGIYKKYYPDDQLPQRIWLVKTHAAPSTIKKLKSWMVESGFKEGETQKFSGVQVTLLAKTVKG